MNPFSPVQKWDVNSCDFELFGLSTMFSAILWFKKLCIVVQTIMEAKKSHFLAWNPTPELQNLRKRQKIMKIQQKMTETTRGRCGGKVGTKSVFTKKKFWKNHPRGKNWKNIFSFFGVFCSQLLAVGTRIFCTTRSWFLFLRIPNAIYYQFQQKLNSAHRVLAVLEKKSRKVRKKNSKKN